MSSLRLALKQSLQEAGGSMKQSRSNRDGNASKKKKRKAVDHPLKKGGSAKDQAAIGDESDDDHHATRERGEEHEDGYGSSSDEENEFSAGEEEEEDESESHTNNDDGEDHSHSHRSHEDESSRPPSRSSNAFSEGEDHDNEEERKKSHRKLQKKLKHKAANKIQNQWKRKKESKVEDEETAEPIQSRKPAFTSMDTEEMSECHSYDHSKSEARDEGERSNQLVEQMKTGDRGSGKAKTAKTVPPPKREVLDWNRCLHPKEARRHVIQGLRVKVRFATKVKREGLIKKKKKWFGGRVAAVSKEGSKIRIKYDDGTAEISKFPDKDVVVDDIMNGEHRVSADDEELQAKLSKFIPPPLPSVVEEDDAADDDVAEDATTQQNEGSKAASIEEKYPPADKTDLREDGTAKKESTDCTKSVIETKEKMISTNCNVVTAPDGHAHADATIEQKTAEITRPSSPPVEGITNWQSAPTYNPSSQREMESKHSPASMTGMEGSKCNSNARNATSTEVKERGNDLDDKLQDEYGEKQLEKEKTTEKPATSKPTLKIRLANPNKARRAIQEVSPRSPQARKPNESLNDADINSKNTRFGNLPGSVTERLPSDKDGSAAASKKRRLEVGQSDNSPVPLAKKIHIQQGASSEDERTSKASSSAISQSEGEKRAENAKPQSNQEKMAEDAKPQSDQEYTLEDAKESHPYQKKIAESTKPRSYPDEAPQNKKAESERRKSPDSANPQSDREIRAGDAKPQPDAEKTALDETKSEQGKTPDIQWRQSDFAPRKQLSQGSFMRAGRADEQDEVEDPTHPWGCSSVEREMDKAGTEKPVAGVENKSKMLSDAKPAEEKAETLDDGKSPASETGHPIAPEVSTADAAAPGTLEETETAFGHGKDAETSSKNSAFEGKDTTAIAGGDGSQEKAVVAANESSNDANNSATGSKLQRRPSTPHDKFEPGSAPGVRSGRKAAQEANERIVSKEKDGDKEKDPSTAQGKKRKKRRESDDDSGEDSKEDHNNWIQCDSCKKWRIIPNQIDISSLPERWYCRLNTYDPKRNTCEAPEETAMPIPRMKKRRGKKRVRQREPEAMNTDEQALSRKDSAQSQSQSDNAKEKTRARSPVPKEDTKPKEAPPKLSSTQKPPRSSPTTLAPVERVSASEGSESPGKPEKKLSTGGGRKRLPDTPLEAIPEAPPVEQPKVKRSRGKRKELKEDNKVPSASAGSPAIQIDNDADNVEWVQCEKCEKWRKLPSHISADELPDVWFCQLNTWNPASASCEAPEDKADGQLDIGAFGGSTGYGGSKLSYRSLIFGSGRKVNRPISERTRAAESIFAAPVDESELTYPQVMYANSSAFAPRGSRANIIEEENNGISVFELMHHSNLWAELRGAKLPVSPDSSFDISSFQAKYSFGTLPPTMKQDMKDMIVRALGTRTLLPEEVLVECHSKKWDNPPPSWAEIRAYCTKDLVITLLCELVTEGTVEIVQAFGAEWTVKDWNPRYRLAMTARNGNVATASAKPRTRCMKIAKPWKRTMGLT